MDTLIGTACVSFFIFVAAVCLILAALFWGLKEIKVLFKGHLPLELGIGDLVWYKGDKRAPNGILSKPGYGFVRDMKNGGVRVEMRDNRDIWILDSRVKKCFNLVQVKSNLQFRKTFN